MERFQSLLRENEALAVNASTWGPAGRSTRAVSSTYRLAPCPARSERPWRCIFRPLLSPLSCLQTSAPVSLWLCVLYDQLKSIGRVAGAVATRSVIVSGIGMHFYTAIVVSSLSIRVIDSLSVTRPSVLTRSKGCRVDSHVSCGGALIHRSNIPRVLALEF